MEKNQRRWVGVTMMKSLIRKLQWEPQGRLKEARRTSPAEEEAHDSFVIHPQALHNMKVHSDGWLLLCPLLPIQTEGRGSLS